MALDLNFDLVKKLVCEQRARAFVERELESRDEFLAFVAHELRTPLNAITGWARFVARGVDTETCDRAIAAIIRSAEAQERIIADLYDAASIRDGKLAMKLKLIELTQTIEAAIETVLPAARDKKLHLKHHICDQNLNIYGDEGRLQQAICNLLNNSIKFTPETGSINLLCSIKDAAVQITIDDTGCGIKPENLSKIFDYSFQAKRGNGLGLGLTISRYIVEQHGGTISADSWGTNQGSTFSVRLPVAEVF